MATIDDYQKLESRIKTGKLDALLARWECGKSLLSERDDAKRLPNGRLQELSNALGSSRSELQNRMQFAEQCPDEEDVRRAFKDKGSWYEICVSGLGNRKTWQTLPKEDRPPQVVHDLLMGVQRFQAVLERAEEYPDRMAPLADQIWEKLRQLRPVLDRFEASLPVEQVA